MLDKLDIAEADTRDAQECAVCARPRYRVLLVDADAALVELIREWLAEENCGIVESPSDAEPLPGPFEVIIVDMPFPRNRGPDVLARVRDSYQDAPILVLSSHFFAGIESAGSIARALGVARVLPKPVTREAMAAAVRHLLNTAP